MTTTHNSINWKTLFRAIEQDEIIGMIEALWEKHPELTFCQLLHRLTKNSEYAFMFVSDKELTDRLNKPRPLAEIA